MGFLAYNVKASPTSGPVNPGFRWRMFCRVPSADGVVRLAKDKHVVGGIAQVGRARDIGAKVFPVKLIFYWLLTAPIWKLITSAPRLPAGQASTAALVLAAVIASRSLQLPLTALSSLGF